MPGFEATHLPLPEEKLVKLLDRAQRKTEYLQAYYIHYLVEGTIAIVSLAVQPSGTVELLLVVYPNHLEQWSYCW